MKTIDSNIETSKILRMIRSLLFMCVIFYTSCSTQYDDYIIIKEGNHYSNIGVGHQEGSSLAVVYTFNESCEYNVDTDQSDKNKLFGLAPNFDINWDNLSFRISWYYDNDSIYLGAYIHDKDLGYSPLKVHMYTSSIMGQIETSIVDCGDSVIFTIQDIIYIAKVSPHKTKGYYIPSPYFGGNRVAQQDIKIKYEKL